MMRLRGRGRIHSLLFVLAVAWLVVPAQAADDPLSSWNDGPAKQAIVAFVQATTEQGESRFMSYGASPRPDHDGGAAGAAHDAGSLADEAVPSARSMRPFPAPSINNGEDVTRPRNLFQVRQRYQRLPDAEGREPEEWITTLRVDLWSGFCDGWKLYGRLDEPLVYPDEVTSSFNPNGHSRLGQGDLLTEVAIVAPRRRRASAMASECASPTGSLNEAGDGKYQVGPVDATRYSLPEISPGSFVLPQVLYLNSVASRNENKGRADINQLNIQPA